MDVIDYMIWIIPYALACYGIAMWGGNKKIGFGLALLISFFLTPIVGFILVSRSGKKQPKDESWRSERISEEYPEEIRIEYSRLLSDFREGEITREEYEKRKAELLSHR